MTRVSTREEGFGRPAVVSGAGSGLRRAEAASSAQAGDPRTTLAAAEVGFFAMPRSVVSQHSFDKPMVAHKRREAAGAGQLPNFGALLNLGGRCPFFLTHYRKSIIMTTVL
jgi:hypothetical protein